MLNSEYHLRTMNAEKSTMDAALSKVILDKVHLHDRPKSTLSAKAKKKSCESSLNIIAKILR